MSNLVDEFVEWLGWLILHHSLILESVFKKLYLNLRYFLGRWLLFWVS